MAYTLLDGERIITGPREWTPKYFEYFLNTDYGISIQLPEQPITGPYVINDSLRIVPTFYTTHPDINPLFEQLAGPKFSFDDAGNHVATYYALDFPTDAVKQLLKSEISKNRWISEVANIIRDINGKTVTLYTNRESRAIYAQAYSLAQDDYSATWKFPEGFHTLNKTDLQLIITEINLYVQSCFEWEAEKNNEIDSKTTVDELRTIALTM